MSANLLISELLEAVCERLRAPALSFSPRYVQPGDLAWYVMNPDKIADLPCIVVEPGDVVEVQLGDGEGSDLAAANCGTLQTIRVVLIASWSTSDPTANRIEWTSEIAERFLSRAFNETLNLGGTVGVAASIHRLAPRAIAFHAPQEEELRSSGLETHLWASQVDLLAQLSIVRT